MNFPDVIIGMGQFVFAIALLPSIFSEDKPARLTCLITAAVLTLFVIAYIMLGLKWSAASCGLTAICWYVLLVQQRYDRNAGAYARFDDE